MCLRTEGSSTICYDRLTCRCYPFDRIETSSILDSWEWWKGELNSVYASCSFLGLGRLPMDSRVVDGVWDYYFQFFIRIVGIVVFMRCHAISVKSAEIGTSSRTYVHE